MWCDNLWINKSLKIALFLEISNGMLPYLLITSSGSGTKVCFNTTKALAVYQPPSIVPPKEGMGVVGEQYEYKVSKNIRPLHTIP